MENVNPQGQMLRNITDTKNQRKKTLKTVVGSFVVVLLGITSGFFLSLTSSGQSSVNTDSPKGVEVSDTEAGAIDVSEFSDEESPIGILKEGGIEGEGTHHLERQGGSTKSVYLTSTVLDLQSFEDKKVQVWGETLSAIKAGWLMDVVKIKAVD